MKLVKEHAAVVNVGLSSSLGVEACINSYLNDGWRVKQMFNIPESSESANMLIVIFVKELEGE